MKYKVEITETLRKVVEVEAFDAIEARQIAEENYKNADEDYILTDNDYELTEFNVL